jgi:hypothetical protein
MLFRFDGFWKLLLGNVGALIFYNYAGFQITTVLLLVTILIIMTNNR